MSMTVRDVVNKLLDYNPEVVVGARLVPNMDESAHHVGYIDQVGNCPVLVANADLSLLDIRTPDPLPWDVVEDMKEAIVLAEGYIGTIPNSPDGLKAYVTLHKVLERLKALTKE
jgi:hypothetical protein